MKTVGIICEYNPFHNGHKYMIDELKKNGDVNIVCVMSGNAVQRGELAVMPALYRAEAAVKCGADTVFELPFPYCCASASYFALAGIRILKSFSVDAVAFGSECADLNKLSECARLSSMPVRGNKGNIGTAASFFESSGIDLQPNDILGVEYIRSANLLGWSPEFIPVKRTGSGHDSREQSNYPSASLIRESIINKNGIFGVPDESASIIDKAAGESSFPIDLKRAEEHIVAFLRRSDPDMLSGCAECGGGVSNRLCAAAAAYNGEATLIKLAATKKYTDARLRRAALFAFTGVEYDDIERKPAYVRLLAANASGRPTAGIGGDIPVVTRISNIPKSPEALRQKELSIRLDSLYTSVMPKMRESSWFYKLPPVIV